MKKEKWLYNHEIGWVLVSPIGGGEIWLGFRGISPRAFPQKKSPGKVVIDQSFFPFYQREPNVKALKGINLEGLLYLTTHGKNGLYENLFLR